jgi:LPXTG-motif cell wall-anchored protein
LVAWVLLILAVIVAGIVFLVFRRRKHKKADKNTN